MLEIIVVVMLGQRLGKKAQSRGLSKQYGWLIVPFWVVPEFAAAFILGMLEAEFFVIYIGALFAAAIGAVIAFQVVGRMGSGVPVTPTVPVWGQSAQMAPPPVPPAAAALRPQAGFCSQCGESVWLTPNGACSRGHGPECISGQYTPAT